MWCIFHCILGVELLKISGISTQVETSYLWNQIWSAQKDHAARAFMRKPAGWKESLEALYLQSDGLCYLTERIPHPGIQYRLMPQSLQSWMKLLGFLTHLADFHMLSSYIHFRFIFPVHDHLLQRSWSQVTVQLSPLSSLIPLPDTSAINLGNQFRGLLLADTVSYIS